MTRKLCVIVFILAGSIGAAHCSTHQRSLRNVECYETGHFYRNPARPASKIWTSGECAKYYLCLDGEVFEFRCSEGLLFDVSRQVCDKKANVHNCEMTTETLVPKPLLDLGDCPAGELSCADGTCLASEYFCDGAADCTDSSDEGWCDPARDPNAAAACDLTTCKLPDCFCSKDGTAIPGKLDVNQIPQMIILTFDDAISPDNRELYATLLAGRRDPHGCPARATFYVSHQHTDYRQVQSMWNDGHEIAVHSVTHRGPEEWWSKNATIEEWFDEMVGQANIINRFANVRMEDLRGLRVPFLRVGWNRQFLMMREFGFVYDASMVAPYSDPPLWPYTLDHRMPHKCMGSNQQCPSRSYPGLWEMVMNPLGTSEYRCAMVDSCPPSLTGDDVFTMLVDNFKRHYTTNRAPYGLYFHSTWFKRPEYLDAFKKFLDAMQRTPDVYFVTNHQAIEWMKRPTPLNKLAQFEPWQCKPRHLEPSEVACDKPNSCKLYSKVLQQEKYMVTCNECPKSYPWLRNEFGFD